MRLRLPASYSLSRRVVTVEELAGLIQRGAGNEGVVEKSKAQKRCKQIVLHVMIYQELFINLRFCRKVFRRARFLYISTMHRPPEKREPQAGSVV